jgi:hypothetical protein
MFCPKCRTEFIEDTPECTDCGSALVNELPARENVEFDKLVNVFTTNNSIEANFIKSLLGSSNIECYIDNEHLVSINIFLSNAIPMKVAVDQKDETRAKEIIAQYFKDLQETK